MGGGTQRQQLGATIAGVKAIATERHGLKRQPHGPLRPGPVFHRVVHATRANPPCAPGGPKITSRERPAELGQPMVPFTFTMWKVPPNAVMPFPTVLVFRPWAKKYSGWPL